MDSGKGSLKLQGILTCWSEMPLILCFIIATGSTEFVVCRGRKEGKKAVSD